jgi:hypothetical protein
MSFAYGYALQPGIDFSRKTTKQEFPIGMMAFDNKGRQWVYVKANGTIAAFKMAKCAASSDPFTNVVIATLVGADGAGNAVAGCTPQALAAGDFAWIVYRGVVEDDAVVISAAVQNGSPYDVSGTGDAGVLSLAADLANSNGVVIVDDTDNTGTILLTA